MNTIPQKLLDLPYWQGHVSAEPLTGGRSNEGYIASDDTGRHIVRFCHNEPVHHVERGHEAMVSRAAAQAGFAPQLEQFEYDGTNAVMMFQFIEAKTYTKTDVIDNLENIVARLSDFHHQVKKYLVGPARLFDVFYYLQDYQATLAKAQSRHAATLPRYADISTALQQVQVPEHLVLAHNDLMPENMLDDGNKLWFIDFEYAAFSTPLSDLANLASNAGLSPQQDKQLLELYFGHTPDDTTQQAYVALKCALALREAMWSFVSEIHLNAPGVDYAGYSDECITALETELEHYQTRYGKLIS